MSECANHLNLEQIIAARAIPPERRLLQARRAVAIRLDDLQAATDAALDARLLTWDPAPVAVALSGGGDSLALLLAAAAWADRRGRPLLALTVDHRLRPESADWTAWCARRAALLGVGHQTLVWEGEKPRTGLAAAARRARHRLLAEAARAAGASVILMGHTADDLAEARLMRQWGGSVSSPAVWSPSPVWPEGRGLFLLRPLLGSRRAALRGALAARGETWIEDPANQDPASARALARIRLADRAPGGEAPTLVRAAAPHPGGPAGWAREGPAGDLSLPLAALADAGEARGRLGAAVTCASGVERPPRGAPLARLLARLTSGEAFAASLSGARIESDGARVHLVRDVADSRRGTPPEIALPRDRPTAWDGRFEAIATLEGARLRALAGRAASLPPSLRRAVLAAAPRTRGALPLAILADGAPALPSLETRPGAQVLLRPLVMARLAAALGAIVDEAAARRMAKSVEPS
jgi:tRNA(Ile)-lysidine synthase